MSWKFITENCHPINRSTSMEMLLQLCRCRRIIHLKKKKLGCSACNHDKNNTNQNINNFQHASIYHATLPQLDSTEQIKMKTFITSDVYSVKSINATNLRYAPIPAGNCLFKVENRNTRTSCKICSKLPGVVLVSLLLTLNIFHTLFQCFYC